MNYVPKKNRIEELKANIILIFEELKSTNIYTLHIYTLHRV